MVWACAIHDRKGPLVVLDHPGGQDGGMTGAWYRDQVLEPYLRPFVTEMTAEHHTSIQFQQDNAPSHTAKLTKAWCRGADSSGPKGNPG